MVQLSVLFALALAYGAAVAAFITNLIWIFKIFVSTVPLTLKLGLFILITIILPFVGIIHGGYIWFMGWTFL